MISQGRINIINSSTRNVQEGIIVSKNGNKAHFKCSGTSFKGGQMVKFQFSEGMPMREASNLELLEICVGIINDNNRGICDLSLNYGAYTESKPGYPIGTVITYEFHPPQYFKNIMPIENRLTGFIEGDWIYFKEFKGQVQFKIEDLPSALQNQDIDGMFVSCSLSLDSHLGSATNIQLMESDKTDYQGQIIYFSSGSGYLDVLKDKRFEDKYLYRATHLRFKAEELNDMDLEDLRDRSVLFNCYYDKSRELCLTNIRLVEE